MNWTSLMAFLIPGAQQKPKPHLRPKPPEAYKAAQDVYYRAEANYLSAIGYKSDLGQVRWERDKAAKVLVAAEWDFIDYFHEWAAFCSTKNDGEQFIAAYKSSFVNTDDLLFHGENHRSPYLPSRSCVSEYANKETKAHWLELDPYVSDEKLANAFCDLEEFIVDSNVYEETYGDSPIIANLKYPEGHEAIENAFGCHFPNFFSLEKVAAETDTREVKVFAKKIKEYCKTSEKANLACRRASVMLLRDTDASPRAKVFSDRFNVLADEDFVNKLEAIKDAKAIAEHADHVDRLVLVVGLHALSDDNFSMFLSPYKGHMRMDWPDSYTPVASLADKQSWAVTRHPAMLMGLDCWSLSQVIRDEPEKTAEAPIMRELTQEYADKFTPDVLDEIESDEHKNRVAEMRVAVESIIQGQDLDKDFGE